MKKFILDYKRYSQKYSRQSHRKIQQFIFEEELEVICDVVDREYVEIIKLEKEELNQVMLRILQAILSQNGEGY